MPYTNKEDQKAAHKRWMESNKERSRELNKQNYERHKEAIHVKHTQWRTEHPDYQKVYWAENKEKLAEANKKYRQEHPQKYANLSQEQRKHRNQQRRKRYPINKEKILARNALYYKEHPLIVLQNARIRRQNNPEKFREYIQKFHERNPLKQTEYTKRKRANKSGCFLNDFTEDLWKIMQDAYAHRCVYCRKPHKKLTQDHIIPLSKGGSHAAGNIVPACQSCNSIKRTRMWWDCNYA